MAHHGDVVATQGGALGGGGFQEAGSAQGGGEFREADDARCGSGVLKVIGAHGGGGIPNEAPERRLGMEAAAAAVAGGGGREARCAGGGGSPAVRVWGRAGWVCVRGRCGDREVEDSWVGRFFCFSGVREHPVGPI